MPPKTRIINEDGRRYEFTPGKNGQTVVRGSNDDAQFMDFFKPPQVKAKVIAADAPPASPRVTETAHNKIMMARKGRMR